VLGIGSVDMYALAKFKAQKETIDVKKHLTQEQTENLELLLKLNDLKLNEMLQITKRKGG
jgi:hypothetical protein